MTIICAVKGKDGVWIGSDTLTTTGCSSLDCGPKIAVAKGWAIGASGDLRCLRLLQHRIDEIVSKGSIFDITNALKKMLADDGFKDRNEGSVVANDNHFVVCSPRKIWEVGIAFDYTEVRQTCCGCGYEHGEGALFTVRKLQPRASAQSQVEIAIRAAMGANIHCGGRCIVRKVV